MRLTFAALLVASTLAACGGSGETTGSGGSSSAGSSSSTGSGTSGTTSGSTTNQSTGGASGSTGGASVSTSGTSSSTSGSTTGALAPTNVTPQTLGLLVNPEDPQSVAVADAYRAARGIPAENVFDLGFTPTRNGLDVDTFAALKQALDADAGSKLQAYAISWTFPFAVTDYDAGCTMSITSAFALGFDEKWCTHPTGGTCQSTADDPYYASHSIAPYTDLGIRPTMMLAGADAGAALAMIARGVASDATYPKGDAYLVITPDATRSVREGEFMQLARVWDGGDGVFVEVVDNSKSTVDNGSLEDAGSALFYLTGLANVSGLSSNRYLDGAVGDSLTSFGGVLSGAGQTTVLDWLYAGLTGSYGTVHEPCNYTSKFSDPTILVPVYTAGATMIEAYWKSVQWPGEGLFVGDPLARPWGG